MPKMPQFLQLRSMLNCDRDGGRNGCGDVLNHENIAGHTALQQANNQI